MKRKVPAHTVICCDKCQKVPSPHDFGMNNGHFVVLHQFKDGVFGNREAAAGKPVTDWNIIRIADRVPKGCVAICKACLLEPAAILAKEDAARKLAEANNG